MDEILHLPRRALIRRVHQRGFTLKSFAEDLGLHPNTVQVIVRRYVGTGKRPNINLNSSTVDVLDALAERLTEDPIC